MLGDIQIFNLYEKRLWQSSVPRNEKDWGEIKSKGVEAVFDLEGYITYPAPGDMLLICWPIEDGDLPDLNILEELAQLAYNLIKKDKTVLVHCAAGINRSSLLAGVILQKLGMRDVVVYLRERRPGALSNPTFADYLEERERSGEFLQGN